MPAVITGRIAWIAIAVLGAGAVLVLIAGGGHEHRLTDSAGGAGTDSAASRLRHVPVPADRPPEAGRGTEAGPSSDPSSVARLVRVTSAGDERPLAGADLALVESDGVGRGRWRTDKDGQATVDVPARRGGLVWLVARASGHATATRRIAPSDREISLALKPGAVIAGRVRTRDGSSLGVPVRVIARPFMSSPNGRLTAIPGETDVRLPHAVTDASGEFVVDGLASRTEYDIDLAGSGLAAETVRRVPSGTTGLELVVQPVFGIVLRFVDERGDPLEPTDGFVGEGRARSAVNFAGVASPMSPDSPSGRLLGLDRWGGTVGGAVAPIFALGDGRSDRIGPVRFTIEEPTRRPRTLDVWLERLTGTIPVQDVMLVPTVAGVRSSTVLARVEGFPEGLPIAPSSRVGFLRLDGGPAGVYYADVIGPPSSERRLRGLPSGNYRVSFEPMFRVGAGVDSTIQVPLSVAAGDTASVTVPFRGDLSTVLLVEVGHDDEFDVTPVPWTLEVTPVAAGASPVVRSTFAAWTEVLCGIEPGEYRVGVAIDDQPESRTLAPQVIRIERGATARVRVDGRRAP